MKKCSVTGCNSDSIQNNSLLFQSFPSTKHIALKWLKSLENLTPILMFEPVQKLCICEKHFENRFLLESGTIADDAYPTLFTPKEIVTGLPENFDDYKKVEDHNYCILRKDKSDHTYSVNDAPENSEKFEIWKKTKPYIIVKADSEITDNSKNVTGDDTLTDITEDNKKNAEFKKVQKTIKTYSKIPAKSGINDISNIQKNPASLEKKNTNNTLRDLKDAYGQPISNIVPSTSKGITKLQPTRHSVSPVDKSTVNKILTINGPITNGYSVKYIDTETDFGNTAMHTYNNQKTKGITKLQPTRHSVSTVDKSTINQNLTKNGSITNGYSVKYINTDMDFDNDTAFDNNNDVNNQITKGITKLQPTRHSVSTVDNSTINQILTIKGPITNDYSLKYIDTETDFGNTAMHTYNNQKTNEATKLIRIMGDPIKKILDSSKILEAKYKKSLLQVRKLKKMVKYKNERIKNLTKFDKKTLFDKLTKHMENPLAKKLFWMQVKSGSRKAKGRRFTDEEKTICTFIRNQNSQCYKLLRKIFALPSTHSLFRYLKAEMEPNNKIDSTTS